MTLIKSILIVVLTTLSLCPVLRAEVELVGKGAILADATDLSGLTGAYEDGTPKNRLGSAGSGITYTGRSNRYLFLSDRGPGNGSLDYQARFHEVDLKLSGAEVAINLKATTLLKSSTSKPYSGLSSSKRRLDPESLRLDSRGIVYIADEYGPSILKFERKTGKIIDRLAIPQKFLPLYPDRSHSKELPPHNTVGRQPGRGFEGLAISPNGKKIYAILQNPLLQDRALDEKNKRIGKSVRLLEIHLKTRVTKEYLYLLDHARGGISDMVAVSDTQFLVIEQDSKPGNRAEFKRIYKIDVSGASDISSLGGLRKRSAPKNVVPVEKKLFIDLMDDRLGLAGDNMPERFEGLAFGPDFKDGRHLLWVTTDNDFDAVEPTTIYAFAIPQADLPEYKPQNFSSGVRWMWMGCLAFLGSMVYVFFKKSKDE